MHYYKRNLGDYAKKAGRLSMLQHGSYTLLIDACYDREQFPTMDEAIEWTWASSAAEIEAVEFVLRKFFTLEGGVYVQKRIQEEIAEYRLKAETNKRIATERETNRKAKSTNRSPDVNEAPPNHKPLTNNHKPRTIKEHTSDKSDLFESFWALWPATDRRTNKSKCAANWKKNNLNAKAAEILSHIAALKKTEKWLSGFEPAPMTYLNGKQWEDGLPTVARLVSINQQPSKQANRDSYAAQAAAAQANLNMGGQQHDEHDITGECARIA